MRRAGRQTKDGYLVPLYDRKPDEPTEYDLARQSMDPAVLRAWVRTWYRSKYVPEDVLTALGLDPTDRYE